MRLETPYPNTVVAESDVEWIQWELHELKRVVARKNWRGTQAALFSLLYTDLINSLDNERKIRWEAKMRSRGLVEDARPKPKQLLALSAFVAVPFFGFGFADNFIMILCGDAIDATFGVRFGLTTLAAAGLGNWVSDLVGLGLGDMIERGATRIGLNNGGLTPSQLNGSTAKFVQLFSKMLGISLGCFAGMLPLVFLSPPKVEFTYEDLQVYNATFGPNGVTTQQFADMMERGRRRRAAPGDVITEAGAPRTMVKLLLRGSVVARAGDKDVCTYVGRLDADRHARPEGLREVPLRGSIMGGAALTDPSLLDKPHRQTCIASTSVEWLEWNINDLNELMQEVHSIQGSFYSMLYGELLTGLQTEERKNQLERYQAVLVAVIADGFVDEKEKNLIRDFQKMLDISEYEHVRCLQDQGWTVQGWDRGYMESVKDRASEPSRKARGHIVESTQELQRASEIIDGVLAGLRRTLEADRGG